MAGTYRQVGIGEATPDAVTVGIERDGNGATRAAIWWDAVGDVDADEAEYDDVASALAAAEAARELHGLREVVIALRPGVEWQSDWGAIAAEERQKEPIGDVRGVDLSDDEAFDLAAGIEAERDA